MWPAIADDGFGAAILGSGISSRVGAFAPGARQFVL